MAENYELSSEIDNEKNILEPYSETFKSGTLNFSSGNNICLLYTSDAADDSLRVDLGGRRII